MTKPITRAPIVTALYRTVPYRTVRYRTALYGNVRYRTVTYGTVQVDVRDLVPAAARYAQLHANAPRRTTACSKQPDDGRNQSAVTETAASIRQAGRWAGRHRPKTGS